MGIQIIGRHGGEETILRAVAAIERRPFHLHRSGIALTDAHATKVPV